MVQVCLPAQLPGVVSPTHVLFEAAPRLPLTAAVACGSDPRTDLGVYRDAMQADTVNLVESSDIIKAKEVVKARQVRDQTFYCQSGQVRPMRPRPAGQRRRSPHPALIDVLTVPRPHTHPPALQIVSQLLAAEEQTRVEAQRRRVTHAAEKLNDSIAREWVRRDVDAAAPRGPLASVRARTTGGIRLTHAGRDAAAALGRTAAVSALLAQAHAVDARTRTALDSAASATRRLRARSQAGSRAGSRAGTAHGARPGSVGPALEGMDAVGAAEIDGDTWALVTQARSCPRESWSHFSGGSGSWGGSGTRRGAVTRAGRGGRGGSGRQRGRECLTRWARCTAFRRAGRRIARARPRRSAAPRPRRTVRAPRRARPRAPAARARR
jgi:hypothetical protein